MKRKRLTQYQSKLIALVKELDSISVAIIQRKLACSYLKACELIEWLEDKKIVGPAGPQTINHRILKSIK